MKYIFIIPFWMLSMLSISVAQKVADYDSGLPLSGVKISDKSGEKIGTTDTSGGCLFFSGKAPKSILIFSLPGYETLALSGLGHQMLVYLKPEQVSLDGVMIRATRSVSTPTSVQLNAPEIKALNTGRDIPFILGLTPGAVTTSDAGNGIGYTGLRIRGTDPTRTNYTINGVPLNDAENQGVFFVNMPDFASSLASVQVQRGLGSSTNGAGAFGSTINMQTSDVREKAGASINFGGGYIIPESRGYQAYQGQRTTSLANIMVHTGNLNNWYFSGRLSYIKSDGYVLRSQSDLQSYYTSAVRKYKNTMVKLLNFGGKEKTGQAWGGIPAETMSRISGQTPSRIYNMFDYPNQTDNYMQNHLQLHVSHRFGKGNDLQVAFHYTRGKGFYEEYKTGQSPDFYQLQLDTALSVSSTDLIRRRWLDNHFYGAIFSHIFEKNRWKFITGGGYNIYDGKHLGEVIWARFAGRSEINHPYYKGSSRKSDFNIYEKITWDAGGGFKVWADLQGRFIKYHSDGNNDYSGIMIPYVIHTQYQFFNPKAGLEWHSGKWGVFNVYVGQGHREPVREDLVNAGVKKKPVSEQLTDIELSHDFRSKDFRFQTTLYFMNYKNQLVTDGSINDVGAYNRINVPESYRSGAEFSVFLRLHSHVQWNFNVALSKNRIRNFAEYIDTYDTAGNYLANQLNRTLSSTPISYSPDLVASSVITWSMCKNANLSFVSKYVSRQFLDNTGSELRSINPYQVHDLQLAWKFIDQPTQKLNLFVLCNNVFNAKFNNNGYAFSSLTGNARTDYVYYFPSALTNFLVKLNLDF